MKHARGKQRLDASKTAIDGLPELVERVLIGIADLAIDADLSMGELNEIARVAYVTAAARRATRSTGTVNRSSVAAITGLTRAEVAQLLRSGRRLGTRDKRSRARRVLDGWSQDARFKAPNGRPRALSIYGPSGSFEDLVKRYAGDIPPRAMLARLQHLSLVRGSQGRKSETATVSRLRQRPRAQLDSKLGELLRILAHALRTDEHAWLRSVFLPASSKIHLAILSKAVSDRGAVFASGLQSSYAGRGNGSDGITVYVGAISDRRTVDRLRPTSKSMRTKT